MGNSIVSNSVMNSYIDRSSETKNINKNIRLMSYNVEWGFLNLPPDIHSDSCGHNIPNSINAQKTHLNLIAKNIGLMFPDICFLQEIGSLEALEFINNQLLSMFNIEYKCYYSNNIEKGFQGVGLLIRNNIDDMCSVENIPNFKLNRALGIDFKYNNKNFKFVGVHLKSLYDQKINKDEKEQVQELSSVISWVKNCQNIIICGDLNNIPGSTPINFIKNQKFTDIFEKTTFINNILNNTNTEFHRKNINSQEEGSRIDYIFTKGEIPIISSHIINIQRECIKQLPDERGETSDHLPIMAILSI